ncbi:MAG: hypothetical protein CMM01_04840 [Rhodopirellula sp.]|nr:hypothetical protein [Rhodopirellula sp.]
MLLDRIDIDTHGPLQRVELGPFSEQINVVNAPEGSGKTALARFIRDALVERQYPLGMLSSSTGRVVFAGCYGLVHYYREQDGTAQGRQTIQHEPRGSNPVNFGLEPTGWLQNISDSNDAELAIQAFKIPEAIADCVITDSAVIDVARVVSACVRSGLDDQNSNVSNDLSHPATVSTETAAVFEDHASYHPDASAQSPDHHLSNASLTPPYATNSDLQRTSKQLRVDLADIEAELASLQAITGPLEEPEYASLLSRRSWLTQCLNENQSPSHRPQIADADPFEAGPPTGMRTNRKSSSVSDPTDSHECAGRDIESEQRRQAHLQSRLRELHDEIRTLRSKRNQLRNRLSDQTEPTLQTHTSIHRRKRENTDRTQKQRQLEDIDAQVIHWQRAQMEVAALQHCMLTGRSEMPSASSPVDERALRRMRLNRFLHKLDKPHASQQEVETGESTPLTGGRNSLNQHILLATRQIDWLTDRYSGPDRISRSWYEQDQSIPGTAATLSSTLRTIRDILRQIHNYNQRPQPSAVHPPMHELSLARRCEQWLLSAIKQLKRHRDEVLRRTHTPGDFSEQEWSDSRNRQSEIWSRERKDRTAELEGVAQSLDTCLNEATEIRRSMRNSGLNEHGTSKTRVVRLNEDTENAGQESARSNRELLVKELQEVDTRISSFSRAQWLRTRRMQCLRELGFPNKNTTASSPLAHRASRWLIRLTGGRLQRIWWSTEKIASTPTDRLNMETGMIEIDGKDVAECPKFDRACVVLAVRMAAGDALARSGRPVPLIIETLDQVEQNLNDRCIDDADSVTPLACHRVNGAFTAALHDYASDGRQLLILTSSEQLTAQLRRTGARIEQIHSERIVHPHRPLWKSSYAAEKYVGPHPHTYGLRDVPEEAIPMKKSNYMPNVNANQHFDMAWQDSQGNSINPSNQSVNSVSSASTDWASDGTLHRDGYYYADSYSTIEFPKPNSPAIGNPSMANDQRLSNVKEDTRMSNNPNVATTTSASPFFLSVDSPIDQGPSIDAVAAARLRGLQVSHIVHLMQQDPCRLADALGLANVEANTIRRWQAECRLVCRVPNLRGFDARILVACGITTPATLAATPPLTLLHKVESFLATDRGQQVLLSGSSHELARITGWIATANSQGLASQTDQTNKQSGPSSRNKQAVSAADDHRRSTTKHGTDVAPALKRNHLGEHTRRQKRKHAQVNHTSETNRTSFVQFEQHAPVDGQAPATTTEVETEIRELRFYLQQDAPVVDAPSIGERMEERLQAIGVYTIQDLLDGDAEQIAEQLDHRRVDADTVLQWQQQTTLVCCIPMLRGHDAQLLVAADIVTPEDLAGWDAEELFQIIDPIARSKEGKRILRGGNLPDLEEVSDWINFAQHNRELQAA